MERTDNELLEVLTSRYEKTVVPACRVCGAPLEVSACGGGEPTRYACSTQSSMKGGIDWTHYENSQWEDRRKGGDRDVMELIRRYLKKTPAIRP